MKLQFTALFLLYFCTRPVTSEDTLGDWLAVGENSASGQDVPPNIMSLLDQVKASSWNKKKNIPDKKVLELYKLRYFGNVSKKFFAVFRRKEINERKKLTILIAGSLVTTFGKEIIIANNVEFCTDSENAVDGSVQQYLNSTAPGPFIQEIIPKKDEAIFEILNKDNHITDVGAAKGTTVQVLIAIRNKNGKTKFGIYGAMFGDMKFFWVVITSTNHNCGFGVESMQRFLSNSKEDACTESENYYDARNFPTVLKRQKNQNVPESEKVFFEKMKRDIKALSKRQQPYDDQLKTSDMILMKVHSAYSRFGLVGVIWVFESRDDGDIRKRYHCWAAIEIEVITGRRFLRKVGPRRFFQCLIWDDMDTYVRTPFPFSPKYENEITPQWLTSLDVAKVFSAKVLGLRGWDTNQPNSCQTIIGHSATSNIVLLKHIAKHGKAYFVLFLRRQYDEIHTLELVYVSPVMDKRLLEREISNYAYSIDLKENVLEDWNTTDYRIPEEYVTQLKNGIGNIDPGSSRSSNHNHLTLPINTPTTDLIGVNTDDPDSLHIEKAQTVSIAPNGNNIIAIVRNKNYRSFVAFTVELNSQKIKITKFERESTEVCIETHAKLFKANVFAFSPPVWTVIRNAEVASGSWVSVITAVQNVLAWNYNASHTVPLKERPIMRGQGGHLTCAIFTAKLPNSGRIVVTIIAKRVDPDYEPWKLLYIIRNVTHSRTHISATTSFKDCDTFPSESNSLIDMSPTVSNHQKAQGMHSEGEGASVEHIVADNKEDADITIQLDKFFKSKFRLRGVEDWISEADICDSTKKHLEVLTPDIYTWFGSNSKIQANIVRGLKFLKMKRVNSSGTKFLLVYEYVNLENKTVIIIVAALRYFFTGIAKEFELRLQNVSGDFDDITQAEAQAQLCVDPFNMKWETKVETLQSEKYLPVANIVTQLVLWRTDFQNMHLVEAIIVTDAYEICFYIFEGEIQSKGTNRVFAAYSGQTLQYLSPAEPKLSLWRSILSYRKEPLWEFESFTVKEDLPNSTIQIIENLIKTSNENGGYWQLGMIKKLKLNFDNFKSARNLDLKEYNRKRLLFELPEKDNEELTAKKKSLYVDIDLSSPGKWTIQDVNKKEPKTH